MRAADLRELLRHQRQTVHIEGRGVSALLVRLLYVGIQLILGLIVERVAHLLAHPFARQARRSLSSSGLLARRAMLTLATTAASIAVLLLRNVQHASCDTSSWRFSVALGATRVLESRSSVLLGLKLIVTVCSQKIRLQVGRLHVAHPMVLRVASLLALLRTLCMQCVDAGLRLEASF